MKILSNKSDSFVLEEKNFVVKTLPLELANFLEELKAKVNKDIVLHHIKTKLLTSNKIALFYQKLHQDEKRKLTFKTWKIQDFISLIYPQLISLNLDCLEQRGVEYFWYIHLDPQIDNYVTDNETWKIFLIDLDSIVYDKIIYQPLYLLVKSGLDNDQTMSLFSSIFTFFLTNQLYLENVKNVWTHHLLDLYIIRLQEHTQHEYKSIESFIWSEYDNLIQILDEIVNK